LATVCPPQPWRNRHARRPHIAATSRPYVCSFVCNVDASRPRSLAFLQKKINEQLSDSFKLNSYTRTRGHQYKLLYKPSCSHNSRATFFSQRVLNVWNALPDSVDFASLNKLKQSILHIDFNDHLACFKC